MAFLFIASAFGHERVKRLLDRWVFRIEKVSGRLLAFSVSCWQWSDRAGRSLEKCGAPALKDGFGRCSDAAMDRTGKIIEGRA